MNMECKSNGRWFGLLALVITTIGIVGFSVWNYIYAAPPRLILNGEPVQTLSLNSVYEEKGATASYASNDLDKRIEIVGTVDTSKRGVYDIEYRLKYHGNILKTNREVRVVDNIAPKILLNGADVVTVSHKSFFKDLGATAIDNIDGDITSQITVSEQVTSDNTYTITYSVQDLDGNVAQRSRELIIKDIVKPVISINGEHKMVIVEKQPYHDSGATAKDDLDGIISSKITVSGGVDTSRIGTHTIVYKVQDNSGNITTATRVVTVVSKATAAANKIYLTFDDGPSTTITPRILDILKKNNIKATFFIVNYSDNKKPIIKRIIDEGHTIGIHGYSHEFSKIYSSDAAFMENVNKLKTKLLQDFGYSTNLIRFPGGSSNTVSRRYSKGIMSRLVKTVPQNGYIYYDWNVSSNDATGKKASKDYIASSVINGLRYGRNNIVLMHDIASKKTTADSLQKIIDYAKTHAYTFAPLTGAVPPAQHRVQN